MYLRTCIPFCVPSPLHPTVILACVWTAPRCNCRQEIVTVAWELYVSGFVNFSFLAHTHTHTHTHYEELYTDIASSELNPHNENDKHIFHANFISRKLSYQNL